MRSGTVAWAVPAVAIALLAVTVASQGNVPAFLWLNGWSRAGGPTFWQGVTILGDTAVALALLTPIVMRRADIAWALVIAAIAATLFVHGFKPFFSEPRPPAVLAPESITVIGPRYTANSFPSGHTTTVFVGAGLICLYFRQTGLRLGVLAIASLVGLSRAVVGVHWPIDILAGAAGGWACAVLGWMVDTRLPAGRRAGVHRAMTAICLGCAIALLAGLKTGYPRVVQLQYAIGAAAVLSWCVASLSRLGINVSNRNQST